ncbi:PLP-dependent aminotransferase family protein [Rheinheimera tangshanensis]|uniref:PLP-dependent aminotransferase family protein n=1 Tax=Rheinheimera tangshanensis TaxID=400153 RepID=A0A5C8LQX6_9GAMM|nr:PLP-dependent aminotransferase family protein [Rheinheimera tangshanensis]TXK78019.1 PLP-dependent aminotransferase family protein [Rheinheimera tangshanensis]GGM70868.1 GntR family transcriptional regulator [Rheinheimera tangshanensis]
MRIELGSFFLSGQGTLQQQLYQALREKLLTAQWPSSALLPSSRQLANELNLSRNTINQVLQQLVAEGYLQGQPGRGYQIVSTAPDQFFQASSGPFKAAETEMELFDYGIRLKSGPASGLLQPGVPDLAAFPFALWQKLTQRHSGRAALAGMADVMGYLPLRQALKDYLRQSRQVLCDEDSILITPGAQAALFVAAKLVSKAGDKVAMESPGYPRLRQALQLSEADIHYIDASSDQGIATSALHQLQGCKALFVTPAHQYPMGGIMPLTERLQLLEWSRQQHCVLVEDDYDSEFQFKHRPIASLQGLAQGQGVIYVGSFSKTLFPALRLGYLVLPQQWMPKAAALLQALYGDVALVPQAVTADFILEGHFGRHLRKMRQLYQHKQQYCLNLIREFLPDAILHARYAGLHLCIEFPYSIADQQLTAELVKRGYRIQPLSRYVFSGIKRTGLVIGLAHTTEQQLMVAVKLIALLVPCYKDAGTME